MISASISIEYVPDCARIIKLLRRLLVQKKKLKKKKTTNDQKFKR